MTTFKQFMEADMPAGQPQVQQSKQFKGTLTDNEKRVLALLSSNQLKAAPSRARDIITGDQNMVQAVRGLKINFKAVDVTPDGVLVNQTGIDLATKHGIVDANTGELTDIGKKLAATTSAGTKNPKTADLSQQQNAAPAQQAPQAQQPASPMESLSLLKELL